MRVAEDTDFDLLKIYLSRNDGWKLEYEKGATAVWTRDPPEHENNAFKMIRVSDLLAKAGETESISGANKECIIFDYFNLLCSLYIIRNR